MEGKGKWDKETKEKTKRIWTTNLLVAMAPVAYFLFFLFFFINEKGVLWAQRAFGEGSMVQPSGLGQRKEMELPHSLGLRTIYIAPLRGRTNLTTRVWVRSLGHG